MERELIYRTFNFETFVGDICTPVLHPRNVLFSPALESARSKKLAVSRNLMDVDVIAVRNRKVFRSRFARGTTDHRI